MNIRELNIEYLSQFIGNDEYKVSLVELVNCDFYQVDVEHNNDTVISAYFEEPLSDMEKAFIGFIKLEELK